MQFSPTSYFILFGSNILLSSLFSDTLSLCSTLNVRDQVSRMLNYRQSYSSVDFSFPPLGLPPYRGEEVCVPQ
jgi:hypothetical protein